MTNTDFTLFKVGYINPRNNKHYDCGEMRGWYAEKFVTECEQAGVVAVVERLATDQSIEDFVLNLTKDEPDGSFGS
jgi:tagatose-1,6-bisphosphate aldolase